MAIETGKHLIGGLMKLNHHVFGHLRVQAVISLVLLPGIALPTLAAERISYIHTDALDSPVAITDTYGVVMERKVYEPYGVLDGGADGGLGYGGHAQDQSTSLIYMQQRYFDPWIGRFLGVDPVTANSGTGANFSRYWYGNNNPYKFTDKDGRCTGSRIANGDGTCASTGGFTTMSIGPPTVAGGGPRSRSGVEDAASRNRISQLHKDVQGPATNLIGEVKDRMGIKLRVVQGLRTKAEQDALYAQGRTAPGDVVTNARGGSSFHNYGLAIDVVGLDSSGNVNWNVDYKGISDIGKEYGFEWGGDFRSIKDMPHFQMTFGKTLDQLKLGDTP